MEGLWDMGVLPGHGRGWAVKIPQFYKILLYIHHTCLPSTSPPDYKYGKIAFQHFQKGTPQIFVLGVRLTVLLSSLINQGYTQVYVIIFTQHPPDIGTLGNGNGNDNKSCPNLARFQYVAKQV